MMSWSSRLGGRWSVSDGWSSLGACGSWPSPDQCVGELVVGSVGVVMWAGSTFDLRRLTCIGSDHADLRRRATGTARPGGRALRRVDERPREAPAPGDERQRDPVALLRWPGLACAHQRMERRRACTGLLSTLRARPVVTVPIPTVHIRPNRGPEAAAFGVRAAHPSGSGRGADGWSWFSVRP